MIKQLINFYNIPYWITDKDIHKSIPLHWHTYYEVEIVTDGTGAHVCNSIESTLEKGVIFLLSPQDFHQMDFPDGTGVKLKTLCFNEEILSPDIKALMKKNPPPYNIKLSEQDYSSFYSDFVYLENIFNTYHENKDMIVSRTIELIILKLAEAARFHIQTDKNTGEIKVFHDLQPIIAYINKHYSEPLGRDELAKIVHLSPSYLSNIFKKSLGITLTDYITDCRMKNAYAMLKHGNESVKNAMEKTGYNSASLFYRHFYKYYGITPGDIKKNK